MCDVCGQEVASITESDLYLRFILGEVRMEELTTSRERHIRCHPELAQFIVSSDFEPVHCQGVFAKEHLDAAFVAEQQARVTRAWRRLQDVAKKPIPLHEYPLPE
ncbi:MAG: hypothetical protein KatS3mg105_2571 [Gemmatales bacterium]|nr:MAG: hypothetical protein KatS3mg105_2571 [Gemmatales bacterium]